ncbi:MAG TPA: alanyl-tRNA editing protein [Burkholderiaceae bacterium]|nr:alanyl-tRNA editing protein [Burkholderiaceae bacterium]
MSTEPLFRDDAYLGSCVAKVVAVHDRGIELDRTVFYPAGGGQPGDIGELRRADGLVVPIVDTRKGEGIDSVVHVPAGAAPGAAGSNVAAPGAAVPLAVGDEVEAAIDWDRRYAMMRIHTCLHVLSCVVVAPVTGGNIAPDKGRLDFDIDMSLLDAQKIEREVNALIERAIDTETVWITDEELDAQPELVKTMSVQPPRGAGRIRLLKIPGVDLQPCGGTHVRNIGEIGPIKVLRIRNEGKRNKRVEIGFASSG